jgi:hypothetical protein
MTRILKSSAISAIALAAAAAPAMAELKYDNNSGGSVLLYGQFSPVFQYVDDGVESYSNLADNAHSNTRVGMLLTQPLGQGTFSLKLETALGLRSSDGIDQNGKPDAFDWDRTKIRHVDAAYDTGEFGKFYIGQGSMATDGIADIDLSGTTMVNYNGISDSAGSFQFRDAGGTLSGITIGDIAPSLDGGRKGRIRYDSPSFSGFTISASAGEEILAAGNNDEFYDVALRYAGEFGAIRVASGLGFSRKDSGGTDTDDTFGSVAVLHDSGFNGALALGSRDGGGDYVYGKIGYQADWFSIGKTSLSFDIYDGSDFVSAGSDTQVLGLGASQMLDDQNLELYFGYRTYEFSEVGTSYQDIDSILAGARWKF